MDESPADFEAFWKKFLADHPSAANRWMHVAALASGITGVAMARRSRTIRPLLIGGALAGTLALVGHPIFQGDRPKNFRKPLWAARAFMRLCVRTVNGRAARELDEMEREAAVTSPGR